MLKNFNKFDRRLLITAALLLLIFSYFLYDDSLIMGWVIPHGPKVARILSSRNDVRIKYAADFRFIGVHRGIIHVGDSIFTGPKSTARIQMEDKSIIEIRPNSLFTFSMIGDQLIINLKSGEVSGDSATVQIVRVEADATAIAEKAKASRSPTSIELPRPVLITPKDYESRKFTVDVDGSLSEPALINMSWEYPKPLAEYEVQIASDSLFKQIEFADVTRSTKLTSPELKEGSHFVRVRENPTQDNRTEWSKPSLVDFVFSKPLLTKAVNAPVVDPNEKIFIIGDVQPPVIEWQPVAGAAKYMLEIGTDSSFKNVRKFKTPEPRLLLANLTPGRFLFRVSAMTAGQQLSPKSEIGRARALVRPPVLNNVEPIEYLAKNKDDKGPARQFTLSWSATPQTDRYMVLISKTADFMKPTTMQATQTMIQLNTPHPSQYYWKVQSQTKNGDSISEFSVVKTVDYNMHDPLKTPEQIEPQDDMTLFFQAENQNPFWMSWKTVQNAKIYILEVALDKEFKTVVIRKEVAKNKYLITEKIPHKNLFWRVQAQAGDRTSGWSTTRQISVFGGRRAGEN